jgi:zinc transporter ZupT
MTLFELFPAAYSQGNPRFIGLFIALGILSQIVMEWFSKGAEHGHVHGAAKSGFPWLLFISLSLHALLEGIPLEQSHHYLIGIVIHKIPVAIILGSFLLRSDLSSGIVWVFMVLFAGMTPLGGLIGSGSSLSWAYPYLLALVIGVVLHVSTVILFESSEGHSFNLRKLAVIILGMALAFFL